MITKEKRELDKPSPLPNNIILGGYLEWRFTGPGKRRLTMIRRYV